MTGQRYDTFGHRRFRRDGRSGFTRPLMIGALAAGFLLAFGCSSSVSDRSVRRIDPSVATRAHAESRTVFVDVRSPEEFAAGHIPGAVNLRLTDIPSDNRPIPALSSARRVVVYGQNPGSAVGVAMTKRLMTLGQHGTVEFFAGGLDAWRAAGGSVQRGER